MTDVESQTIQKEVERVYRRFLDVVQESRGFEKREDLEAIAEGRVWSGRRAKELGLVDELGGLDQALAKARQYAKLKSNSPVIIFPRPMDPLSRLMQIFSDGAMDMMADQNTLLGAAKGLIDGHFSSDSESSEARLMKQISSVLKEGVHARLFFDSEIR
jgi:protease-4